MTKGYTYTDRLTAAQIAGQQGLAADGVFIQEIDNNGQPSASGNVYWSGAAGQTPEPTGGAASGGASGYTKGTLATVTPAQADLTFTEVHYEGGLGAVITLNADDLTSGKTLLFNYSGAPLTISMVDGVTREWSGGISEDGDLANDVMAPFTVAENLVVIPHAKKVMLVWDADGWVRASVLGVEVTQVELNAHTDDVANPHGVTKTQVGLANVDNTADSAKPVSAAQQTALDGKQATLVSGTNVKTVNGTSLLGSGNLSIAADLPGGQSTTVTDEGLDSGNATIDRATVPGETILKYLTAGASTFKVPLGVSSIVSLVVAGGASGGQNYSGGGGAGEVITSTAQAVTPGTSYTVTVGAGGASVADNELNTDPGNAGGNSSIGSLIIAVGGGRGGNGSGSSTEPKALSGGSGGGGGGFNASAGVAAAAGAAGTLGTNGVSFRNAGGDGDKNGNKSGGGGGGAGAAGTAAGSGGGAGAGGAGTSSSITGSAVTYGGGGGGGAEGHAAGGGGSGGGGGGGRNGVNNGRGVDATANTGGGGGGGAQTNINSNAASGAGGSGIVVIRFVTQSRSYQALQTYADNAAAVTGGRLVGEFYKKTSDGSVQQVV